ncbi:MAG: hypothetical protein Q8M06_04830 [Methanobacteriaceae archaeon]|nr:hypothetical protein [Methanobacteriaceae archaeon]MDZ4171836.1 hypothetical protein [Methanobacteriaceae archaeon]
MLLPHEPLIKIVHSRIKCYNHKTQKKNKNGELHTYTTKQYMVPLKIDQPFSCEKEITVLLSEDYFMMNKLLQQRKKEYDDYLERNIILEREVNNLKEKLKQKEVKMNMNNSNQGKMEKDFQATAKNYEKKNSELVNQLKKINGELIEAKKEIKSHEAIIKELKEGSIMGKISGIWPHKKTNSEKSDKK